MQTITCRATPFPVTKIAIVTTGHARCDIITLNHCVVYLVHDVNSCITLLKQYVIDLESTLIYGTQSCLMVRGAMFSLRNGTLSLCNDTLSLIRSSDIFGSNTAAEKLLLAIGVKHIKIYILDSYFLFYIQT